MHTDGQTDKQSDTLEYMKLEKCIISNDCSEVLEEASNAS